MTDKLYALKPMPMGFVILCQDSNIGCLSNTIKSIRKGYPLASIVAVTTSAINKKDLQEMRALCPTHQGGTCITSLINTGMAKTTAEWNMIVMAGTWVRLNLDRKFSYFMESKTDIFFPVVDRKTNFVDGTLNGITIHKDTFKKVGKFGTDNPIEVCKLFWSLDAIEKGCKFKAVVGAKIC